MAAPGKLAFYRKKRDRVDEYIEGQAERIEYDSRADLVKEVGYIELTPQIYELARQHFADRKVGTAFGEGGSQVGMTLEALLATEDVVAVVTQPDKPKGRGRALAPPPVKETAEILEHKIAVERCLSKT